MRSNAVGGGGGLLYFKLGVGWCSYDASTPSFFGFYTLQRRYDMNGRTQMQGDKNWILPKEINAKGFFSDSPWLEIWKNPSMSSMESREGSVSMDSGLFTLYLQDLIDCSIRFYAAHRPVIVSRIKPKLRC
jgi:hypothetical protein